MTIPLVLVHGLWDTPRLFHRLIQGLDQADRPLLAPHLPHGLGWVPLRQMAFRLDQNIQQRFGSDTRVDLLGFSMGGVIGRIWLQELGECSELAVSSAWAVRSRAPWPRS